MQYDRKIFIGFGALTGVWMLEQINEHPGYGFCIEIAHEIAEIFRD